MSADPHHLRNLRPRRTHVSRKVYRLPGGNEDNDLWVEEATSTDGGMVVCSVWELTPEDRALVAAGANVEVLIHGGQPPMGVALTSVPLGRCPQPDDAPDAS